MSATAKKSKSGKIVQPAIFTPKGAPNVLFIRAAQLMKKTVTGGFNPEMLTLGHAIIHDKIVVVDPLSPECAVISFAAVLGSMKLSSLEQVDNLKNLATMKTSS